jgi:lactose/L-arabinose transport system substrate-binding protein
MDPETPITPSTTPDTSSARSKTLTRGTFLKGAAATAAAVGASGVATTVARAASRVEVVSSAPSGAITIWVNGNAFAPAQVAAFNKVYPNVKVTQKITAYVPNTPSLSAHLVTGVGVPDGIFFMEDAFLGQFAPNLYDVSKQVAPYASKIAPYKINASKQNGRMVGIPWDVDPAFLIYRMDIVGKAGVDVSKIATYDDLIAAARTVKAKVPGCTGPLFFLDSPGFFQFVVEGLAWQQGTGIIDAQGKLNLRAKAYTNAFNYLEKAYKAGVVSFGIFTTPALYNSWNQGKTCFLHFADWFSHWNEQGLKPSWGKIGLAKQPVFNPATDSPYSMMGGSAYTVPLKAKNPELGALFGTFQLFEPAALQAGNAANIYEAILPSAEALWPDVNLNAFRHARIIAPSIDEHSLLVTAAKNAPSHYRYPPWYSNAYNYYGAAVRKVLTGQLTAAQGQEQAYNDVLTKVVQRWTG